MSDFRPIRISWRRADGERGQALVELALTIILFMLLSLGIVEFGRILMIVSVVTHAARDGARSAAVEVKANRNSSGIIQNWSAIEQQVTNQIANVTTVGFTVTHNQPSPGGIPVVEVTVTANGGGIPYLFAPLLFPSGSATLPVTRTVSFRDEGR